MTVPRLKTIIDGPSSGETLFFVQGWPDDHTVWDDQVAALSDRYRCVRVDMPNYGEGERRRWGRSHEEIVDALANAVREISPSVPITLIGHDWGAIWCYGMHHRNPELVVRLVGLDVAPHMSPTPREVGFIIAYQWWLLGAFVAGGSVGDWMTRRMARLAGAPRHAEVDASMNYPYLYTWRDLVTGHAKDLLRGYRPKVPVLFMYGVAKPGRFHSDAWLELVRSGADSEVVALEGRGHWVMRDPKFNGLLERWLDRTEVQAPRDRRG